MAQAQRRWTIESGDEGSGSGKSDENLVKTREKRVRKVVKQSNSYYVGMYGCYANDATVLGHDDEKLIACQPTIVEWRKRKAKENSGASI